MSLKFRGFKSGIEINIYILSAYKVSPEDSQASNHQLPVAEAFQIIWIVSTEEWSSFTQNLMQIHCSVILNATATQYTCWLKGVTHWLVQWSHHCSHMCIPVSSPWLPGYIDVMQTILIILTMAGLFLDRLCIYWLCIKGGGRSFSTTYEKLDQLCFVVRVSQVLEE